MLMFCFNTSTSKKSFYSCHFIIAFNNMESEIASYEKSLYIFHNVFLYTTDQLICFISEYQMIYDTCLNISNNHSKSS